MNALKSFEEAMITSQLEVNDFSAFQNAVIERIKDQDDSVLDVVLKSKHLLGFINSHPNYNSILLDIVFGNSLIKYKEKALTLFLQECNDSEHVLMSVLPLLFGYSETSLTRILYESGSSKKSCLHTYFTGCTSVLDDVTRLVEVLGGTFFLDELANFSKLPIEFLKKLLYKGRNGGILVAHILNQSTCDDQVMELSFLLANCMSELKTMKFKEPVTLDSLMKTRDSNGSKSLVYAVQIMVSKVQLKWIDEARGSELVDSILICLLKHLNIKWLSLN